MTHPDPAAEAAAAAAAQMTLDIIQVVNTLADTAQQMKEALEVRGFSPIVSEPAAVQFMWMMGQPTFAQMGRR